MRIWFDSYLYRPGEWDGKEWAVQKINRENESHEQKNQGLNTLNFIPVHKNTYFEIKSVAKSLV